MTIFYTKNKSFRLVACSRISLLIAFTLLFWVKIFANTYTVTAAAGDGTASNQLRGAIKLATDAGGSNTILVKAGIYNLTGGQIFFTVQAQTLTITGDGDGSTVINMSSTGTDRIFNIGDGMTNGVNTIITGIKFNNGSVTTDNFGGGAIICGGPNNTTTIKNCVFNGNKAAVLNGGGGASGGGAICCSGGSDFTVDSCTFTNNTNQKSNGGAIFYTLPVNYNPSGTCKITNSVFNGNVVNSVNNAGAFAEGGAVSVGAQGSSTAATFSITITGNTFINNTSTGAGGAIAVNNAFKAGNASPGKINYNRFLGNSATAIPATSAVEMGNTQANLDATNNWWGCNGGPTSCTDKGSLYLPSGGALATFTASPYLVLTTSADVASLCPGNAGTITTSFLKNSNSQVIDPANLKALVGVAVSYSTTLGSLSNQQLSIQASGTATATYTAGTTSGGGGVTTTVDAANATASITVNQGTAITTQPATSTTVCSGANTSFSVVATGLTLTYQWYKGAGNTSPISGATSATLSLTGVTTASAGTYHVVVSGTCGSVTSNDATLNINVAPAFTTQPATTTPVCVGNTAMFTAAASGTPTPTYQWRKGTTNLANGATANGSAISGATTATLVITNTAAADAANYNVVATNTCNTVASNDAALVVNLPPSIGTQPATTTTICTGNAASFTVGASGTATLTYQWYKGATAITNGTTSQGSIISGATTATLNIANASPTDNATNYNVVVSNGCTATATSNNAALTVTAPTLIASGSTSGTSIISGTNYAVNGTSCAAITKILPSGAVPVSGSVTATVTIDATVQTAPGGNPYVQRHFDIVPATNPSTATATLTLYFSQTDFNNYNTFNTRGGKLPTGPSDVADIANIRIGQYHGTGTGPGNYSGVGVDIDPDDNNIVWNATYSRWEITFNTVGFSGFFLTNMNSILPLSLLSFTGNVQGSNALLQWTTNNEINADYFELQQSIDGVNFDAIAKIATTGNNGSGTNYYQYTDKLGANPVYYYKLKMVDKDGRFTLSDVVSVKVTGNTAYYIVRATPNPFHGELLVNIVAPEQAKTTLMLMDMSGKVLLEQTSTLSQGTNNINLRQLDNFAKGTYLLRIFNSKINQTIKVVRAQ